MGCGRTNPRNYTYLPAVLIVLGFITMNWQTQRLCTDIGGYELVVEKQKQSWECSQKRESWKWLVNYHGAVVANGSVNSLEEAQQLAVSNVPGQI